MEDNQKSRCVAYMLVGQMYLGRTSLPARQVHTLPMFTMLCRRGPASEFPTVSTTHHRQHTAMTAVPNQHHPTQSHSTLISIQRVMGHSSFGSHVAVVSDIHARTALLTHGHQKTGILAPDSER